MRVLVADQEIEMLEAVGRAFDVDVATSKATCIDLLRANHFDVLVACERLSDGSGLELLSHVGQRWPHVVRILVIEPERRAMLRGRLGPFKLFETLSYPIDDDKLEAALGRAAEAIAENEASAPTVAAAPRGQGARNQGAQGQIAQSQTGQTQTGKGHSGKGATAASSPPAGGRGASGASGNQPAGGKSSAGGSFGNQSGGGRGSAGASSGAPGSGALGSSAGRSGSQSSGALNSSGRSSGASTEGSGRAAAQAPNSGVNSGGAQSGRTQSSGASSAGASSGGARGVGAQGMGVRPSGSKGDARQAGGGTGRTSSAPLTGNVPPPSARPSSQSSGKPGSPGLFSSKQASQAGAQRHAQSGQGGGQGGGQGLAPNSRQPGMGGGIGSGSTDPLLDYPPLPAKGSKIVPLGSPDTTEYKIVPHDYQGQNMPGMTRAQREASNIKQPTLQEKAASLAAGAMAAVVRYMKPQSPTPPSKTVPRKKR